MLAQLGRGILIVETGGKKEKEGVRSCRKKGSGLAKEVQKKGSGLAIQHHSQCVNFVLPTIGKSPNPTVQRTQVQWIFLW